MSNKKKLGRWAFNTIYIVLCCMLAFNLYNVISCVMGNDLPKYFGVSLFCLEDQKKISSLSGGSLIIVDTVDPKTLEVGDSIVFRYGDEFAVSRILYVQDVPSAYAEGGFVLSNNGVEVNAAITYDEVCGRVIGSVRYLGNLFALMTSEAFNLMICSLLAGVLLVDLFFLDKKLQRYREMEEREKANRRYAEMYGVNG